MSKGKIILIEGTDCSGKGTQTELLYQRMCNLRLATKTMSFPRYDTPTGRIVGQCYLGKDRPSQDSPIWNGEKGWFSSANEVNPQIACLYYAADRKAALPRITEIIESGTHLVLDRYVESNMAHQGGKIKNQRDREKMFRFIENLEYKLLGLPRPDITLFLHMPYEVAIELKKNRPGKPDQHESNPEHLRNAEQTYIELAQRNNWVTISCAPNKTLKTKGKISDEIWDHVKKIISFSQT